MLENIASFSLPPIETAWKLMMCFVYGLWY